MTRRRPDCIRNSTSRRLNSCLLIDNTATAHLPGHQNPGCVTSILQRGVISILRLQVGVAESTFWKIAARRTSIQGQQVEGE